MAATNCALHVNGNVCLPPNVFQILCRLFKLPCESPDEAVKVLTEKLNCKLEHELLGLPEVQTALRDNGFDPDDLILIYFKPIGTWHEKALLNDQIDDTLRQWQIQFPGFCNLGFTMMNFADYDGTPMQWLRALPDLLSGSKTITFIQHELGGEEGTTIKGPVSKFACVLNSDIMGGKGKHWTCIFIDLATDFTVEFFNSSGNPPYPAILKWQRQAVDVASQATGKPVRFVHVSEIRHQYGKAECGVYALYYIYRRLSGIPSDAFKHTLIPDAQMTEFRKSHLFREG